MSLSCPGSRWCHDNWWSDIELDFSNLLSLCEQLKGPFGIYVTYDPLVYIINSAQRMFEIIDAVPEEKRSGRSSSP